MVNYSHDLDIVIPVYNEERILEQSVTRLCAYLRDHMPYAWTVTIADNASTDGTAAIALRLAESMPGVSARILPRKGRGYALKTAWMESTATVRAYLDVDLSTDLSALPALIAPLISGHSDISIGTRLASTSRIVRRTKRDLLSRGYNALLRSTLSIGYSDAQCGFKAITADVAHAVLPYVADTQWFFDTELLTIAERAGLRIHEVPVDWVDDLDSRVDVPQTVREDIVGILRLHRSLRRGEIPIDRIYARMGRTPLEDPDGGGQHLLGQTVRFCLVGGASTIAYVVLYLVFGVLMDKQAANFGALIITAVANTAANRAFTFNVHGGRRLASHHVQGITIFAFSWALTASALSLLRVLNPDAGAVSEIIVLTGANLVGTGIRFIVFRYITFRRRDITVGAEDVAAKLDSEPAPAEPATSVAPKQASQSGDSDGEKYADSSRTSGADRDGGASTEGTRTFASVGIDEPPWLTAERARTPKRTTDNRTSTDQRQTR